MSTVFVGSKLLREQVQQAICLLLTGRAAAAVSTFGD